MDLDVAVFTLTIIIKDRIKRPAYRFTLCMTFVTFLNFWSVFSLAGFFYSIGLAIAERLAEDGASVMISSRKQQNVDKAVQTLKDKGLSVSGVVCHVAKKEHRQTLIEKVQQNSFYEQMENKS